MTTADGRWFDMELDFCADVLSIRVSDGGFATVALAPRPVADFYADTVAALRSLGISLHIFTMPCEIVDADEAIPFPRDTMHRAYDKAYVLAFWQIVARVTTVLTEFRAGYVGKASPPLLFWGHFDLSLSVFSGRPMPPSLFAQLTDKLDREGYSHELVTVGWWPGDRRLPKPTFFGSVAPEPAGFSSMMSRTPAVHYDPGIHSYCLDYDAVRTAPDPARLALDFFRATYAAAADLGDWDRKALDRN